MVLQRYKQWPKCKFRFCCRVSRRQLSVQKVKKKTQKIPIKLEKIRCAQVELFSSYVVVTGTRQNSNSVKKYNGFVIKLNAQETDRTITKHI